MSGKRQLNKNEQILWEKFTYSVRALNHAAYDAVLQSSEGSMRVRVIKKRNSISEKPVRFINHAGMTENSFFIQHYKLFKSRQARYGDDRERYIPIGEKHDGLDNATWKRLQKGAIRVEQTLDLHNFTAQHAFTRLENFLISAYHYRFRCVEVITGVGNSCQGGGILKRELPHWLNRPCLRSIILATTYVSPQNGGAVRILLRRNHQERG